MSLVTMEMIKTNYDPKITMYMSAYAKAIVDTQNETIDKVLEIIDKTYEEYARHLPIEEYGRGSNLTQMIKDAVQSLQKGGDAE